MIKKCMSFKRSFTSLFLLLIFSPAFSQGLENVNSLLDKISGALQAAAVVTVTVAVFWSGYKIVFGGSTVREIAPILLGGIVIGSAAQIAGMLVGK